MKKVDDKQLLALCLSGYRQTDIARELKMTPAAVSRRINKPAFQDMLAEYRKRVIAGAMTELTANTQKSVNTLVELLEDESSFIRLKASSKILELAQEYSVQNDIMRDIEEWKQAQENTFDV